MAAQIVQKPLLQAAKAHQLDIKILCNDQPQGLEKRNRLLVLYRFLSTGRCCPAIHVAVYTLVPAARQARRLAVQLQHPFSNVYSS